MLLDHWACAECHHHLSLLAAELNRFRQGQAAESVLLWETTTILKAFALYHSQANPMMAPAAPGGACLTLGGLNRNLLKFPPAKEKCLISHPYMAMETDQKQRATVQWWRSGFSCRRILNSTPGSSILQVESQATDFCLRQTACQRRHYGDRGTIAQLQGKGPQLSGRRQAWFAEDPWFSPLQFKLKRF